MIPAAEIRHALSARTRIVIAERRGYGDYFASLVQTLQTHTDVVSVSANPLTASVVIEHVRPFDGIASFAQREGLFQMTAVRTETHTPVVQAAAGLAALDGVLKRLSEGDLNARSAILLTLIALAAVQAARGHVLGPASTLLWAALSLVRSEGK